MTSRTAIGFVALATAGAGILWALFVVLPDRYATQQAPAGTSTSAPVPPTAERKIAAHLFFVASDGVQLTSVEQDVVYGEGPASQASRIIEAQLGPAPEGYTSPIPPGTTLRTVFVSDQGDAFVDLSPELRAAHPGGSLNELFTVYAIVNALTVNIPAIAAVQILIGGNEVDSLAGHVDLRQPLQRNMRIVTETSEPVSDEGRVTSDE